MQAPLLFWHRLPPLSLCKRFSKYVVRVDRSFACKAQHPLALLLPAGCFAWKSHHRIIVSRISSHLYHDIMTSSFGCVSRHHKLAKYLSLNLHRLSLGVWSFVMTLKYPSRSPFTRKVLSLKSTFQSKCDRIYSKNWLRQNDNFFMPSNVLFWTEDHTLIAPRMKISHICSCRRSSDLKISTCMMTCLAKMISSSSCLYGPLRSSVTICAIRAQWRNFSLLAGLLPNIPATIWIVPYWAIISKAARPHAASSTSLTLLMLHIELDLRRMVRK